MQKHRTQVHKHLGPGLSCVTGVINTMFRQQCRPWQGLANRLEKPFSWRQDLKRFVSQVVCHRARVRAQCTVHCDPSHASVDLGKMAGIVEDDVQREKGRCFLPFSLCGAPWMGSEMDKVTKERQEPTQGDVVKEKTSAWIQPCII